ncbi:hypothetical protein [Actinotalea sp. Marseille-Q4924]|uniref:hypothetical protein n=1 Tax=Actinotalea sp. Marseille-Q4924 TaxID=2866571 RepID=UPI001CE46273|nr:hypothetical protein [Actinotalea sp. Marseille-Q4924]
MRRPATLAAAFVLSAFAVTGCATGDEQPEQATDRDLEVEDLTPAASPEPFDAGAEEAPTRCSDLSPAPDGRYPVGEAGTVTVTVADDGEALVLEDVEAAEGWEHEVAQEDDVAIDVRFTPDDAESARVALVAVLGNDAAGTDMQPEILVQYCDAVP